MVGRSKKIFLILLRSGSQTYVQGVDDGGSLSGGDGKIGLVLDVGGERGVGEHGEEREGGDEKVGELHDGRDGRTGTERRGGDARFLMSFRFLIVSRGARLSLNTVPSTANFYFNLYVSTSRRLDVSTSHDSG